MINVHMPADMRMVRYMQHELVCVWDPPHMHTKLQQIQWFMPLAFMTKYNNFEAVE